MCSMVVHAQVVHYGQNVHCAYWVKLTAHVIGGRTEGGAPGVCAPPPLIRICPLAPPPPPSKCLVR